MRESTRSWRTYGAALSVPRGIRDRLRHAKNRERPVGGTPDITAASPSSTSLQDAEWLERLVASGIVQRGQTEIPRDLFANGPRVGPLAASVLDALIEERQEGR